MSTHHILPAADDFAALTGDFDAAVTLYVATSPVTTDSERSRLTFKNALGEAAAQLDDPAGVLAQGEALLADDHLWETLSGGLAAFLTPSKSTVFVLPNRLDDETAVGTHFELGQLWRSVSQLQEAFALTISADGWQLWHATPTGRIAPLEVAGDHPADAGKATKRAAAGREDDRLAGDPYDLYAKRVADAATAELAALDPDNDMTLFVFGDERLVNLFAQRKDSRRIVAVAGNPDKMGAHELDANVRGQLADLNLEDTKAEIAALGEGAPDGVEHDLAAIARMAVKGGVEDYWFDFTTHVPGTLDMTTGELTYADMDSAATAAGVSDLLARIAQLVNESGGSVIAVRGADLGDGWRGPALARLRFSLG